MVIWWLFTVIPGFRFIISLTIFLLVNYTQKRLFDIMDANLIFDGFIIELRTWMYSIYGIPLTVLKIIAWSFFRKIKISCSFGKSCLCVIFIIWFNFGVGVWCRLGLRIDLSVRDVFGLNWGFCITYIRYVFRSVVPNSSLGTNHFYKFSTITDHYLIPPPLLYHLFLYNLYVHNN